jgi:heat-inducible transcriptional repressor
MMLTARQELLLRKVVETHLAGGQPVGSKLLASEIEVTWGPSTVRNELAQLEEHGLLAHPHTSAGRVPTDAGYRYFVDRLLGEARATQRPRLELQLIRREVDEAMRVTTETLSRVTRLLAVVSAPPIETATVRHVELVPLQPEVLMVVTITSAGGVTKRIFSFDEPVDQGLVDWAGSYLNERLVGVGLGARMLHQRLGDPGLSATERSFLERISPAFTDLAATAEDSLYMEGTARLLGDYGFRDVADVNRVLELLERRVALLGVLGQALEQPGVFVRIGAENESPALRSLAVVAASYGLPARRLGTVSVIGPVRMDYAGAIDAVRDAAAQLSRFIEDVYAD